MRHDRVTLSESSGGHRDNEVRPPQRRIWPFIILVGISWWTLASAGLAQGSRPVPTLAVELKCARATLSSGTSVDSVNALRVMSELRPAPEGRTNTEYA
jgi:hypothetical protein